MNARGEKCNTLRPSLRVRFMLKVTREQAWAAGPISLGAVSREQVDTEDLLCANGRREGGQNRLDHSAEKCILVMTIRRYRA